MNRLRRIVRRLAALYCWFLPALVPQRVRIATGQWERGGLFGNNSTSGSDPTVHKLKVNSSTYGTVIPLVYGRARLPAIFLWDGGFYSQTSTSGAGKGFGTGSGGTVTTYFLSVVLGLCTGVANGFGRVWHTTGKGQKREVQTQTNWTIFTGALAQTAWNYLTSKHPGQDIGYTGIAYVARQAWPLGTSANPPNMSFEVFGLLSTVTGNSTAGYIGTDVNAGQIIYDFLTNVNYGCAVPTSYMGNLLTTFEQYCLAAGYNLSPIIDQQKKAVEWIKDLLHICNADGVWSQGVFNVVPFCDANSTSLNGLNGSTFNANVFLTAVYSLTDDDFVTQDKAGATQRKQLTNPEDYDPITVIVTSPADLFNDLTVEYVNAGNDYNLDVVEATDEGDIVAHGLRKGSPLQFHPITTAALARQVVQIQLQQQRHTPNQYRFRVTQRYVLLDPMDVVNITDPGLGLNQYPVRIIQIDEEMDDQGGMIIEGTLIITAQDLGPNTTPGFNTQPPGPWGNQDPNRVPLPINTPIIFEPDQSMMHAVSHQLSGGREIWMLTSGNEGDNAGDYQGCNIYMSLDGGTSYNLVGVQRTPATQGTLVTTLPTYGGSNPDTTHTLEVDLSESNGIVSTVTAGLGAKKQNLCYVQGNTTPYEIMAFETETAAGAGYQYNLTRLYRGLYKSKIQASSAGNLWGFIGAIHNLDPGVFRLPITQDMIGAGPIYFKFLPVNPSADGVASLASATAYSISPVGGGTATDVTNLTATVTKKKDLELTWLKPSNLPSGLENYEVRISYDTDWTSGIVIPGGAGGNPAYGVYPLTNNAGGYTFTCTTGGTTSGSYPAAWNQTPGGTTTDAGGVVWTNTGAIGSSPLWATATYVDGPKQAKYLVTDPPVSTNTWWVGVLDKLGNYDPTPPSITGNITSGFSPGGGTGPVIFPTGIVNTGGWYDVENAIAAPLTLAQLILSDVSYTGGSLTIEFDWYTEDPPISSSPGVLNIFMDSGTHGASGENGYLFYLDARSANHRSRIVKVANGASSDLADGPVNGSALPAGWHHIACTWFLGGAFQVTFDGAVDASAQDTTYTLNGPIGYGYVAADVRLRNPIVTTDQINSALPDPTSFTATQTHKGDVQLAWHYTSPRPKGFSHFEIRTGSSFAGGSFLDTTKKLNYLIVDPAAGATTYWVAAVNTADQYDPTPPRTPPSGSFTVNATPDVTSLTATVTKKKDILLQWTKPSSFPNGLAHYEIRTGSSWAAGTYFGMTRKDNYLINDPNPNTVVTYWVGVLDLNGNYDASPPSVTGDIGQGFSLAPAKQSFVIFGTDIASWIPYGAGVAFISPDGLTWAPAALSSAYLYSGAFNGSQWVAVGYGGVIYTSNDGIVWTAQTSGTIYNLFGVCWSPALSLWVVTGYGASSNYVLLTSPDGITWTSQTSANAPSGLAWSPLLGTFCCCLAAGTSNPSVQVSTNGTSWTTKVVDSGSSLYASSIVWADSLGLFVLICNSGSGNSTAYTSPDGSTWTFRKTFAGFTNGSAVNSLAWSGSLLVVCGIQGGTGTLYTSPDGITWTIGNNVLSGIQLSAIGWNGACFIAMGASSTSYLISDATGLFWQVVASSALGTYLEPSCLAAGIAAEPPSISAFDDTVVLSSNVNLNNGSNTTILSVSIVTPPGKPCRIEASWQLVVSAAGGGVIGFWVTDGTNKWAAIQRKGLAGANDGVNAHGKSPTKYLPNTNVTISLIANSSVGSNVVDAAASQGGPNGYMHIATIPSN